MSQPLLGRLTEETSPSSLLINKNGRSCISLNKHNPIFPVYRQIVAPDSSYFLHYTEFTLKEGQELHLVYFLQ